jgi:membrane protein
MSFTGNNRARTDETALAHIARAVWHEVFSDHATVIAAGLAYYAIFGLLPALAGAAALWGLFGDTGALQSALQHSGGVLPPATARLLEPFLTSVPHGFGGGIALLLNVLLVVWTAFRAAGGLLIALNVVYDLEESRSRVHCACVSLAIGVSGIAVLFLTVALLALARLAAAWMEADTARLLLWLRWPVLIAMFAAMLALLFRYAPDRKDSHMAPLCWGVLASTVLCLLASSGISLYVGHVASYGRLYGTLGSIAIALFWLYSCALALLIGAEIDAVLTIRQRNGPPDTST